MLTGRSAKPGSGRRHRKVAIDIPQHHSEPAPDLRRANLRRPLLPSFAFQKTLCLAAEVLPTRDNTSSSPFPSSAMQISALDVL